MKGKKTRFYFISLILLAAALMGMGLFRVVLVYQHYRADMLTYESRHLDSIVSSSGRGMDWMMGGYDVQVTQFLGRREFIHAEESYLETGDLLFFRELMARPDVRLMGDQRKMAVFDADGVLLASTDEAYPLNLGADEAVGQNAVLRCDESGTYWFVFGETSDSGLLCEMAVSVQALFSYHAEVSHVGRGGYLFLMDAGGQMFSYSDGGVTATESVEELLQTHASVDAAKLEELANRVSMSPEDYVVVRFPWPEYQADGGNSEETLVVTSPLVSSGGTLVVGAALSFREFDSFLSDTLEEVTWIILMEIGGALILFLVAAWILVMNRRDRLELQAVKERADLMEEINRQQQSLEHTERLQQLGVMTSGIVHEFNNMLTPIMSQSMLLLEELADQEDSPPFESALDIYEASENAREMLRRMSALSKKNVDIHFQTLELGGLLRNTVNLSAMAKDPHIIQEIILPGELMYVRGNSQLLTQAFLNICINACQAMGSEGTLTIKAWCEMRSSHAYACVEIADTGPGIPPEQLKSIYEPYFTTKGERGTGLGLAICKKIIETHKGTISAANREGGGAIFTVRIPAIESTEEE